MAFIDLQKKLANEISLVSNEESIIKIIDVSDYLHKVSKMFIKTCEAIENENDAKVLFLDFLEIKKNIDDVYTPTRDIDEYTLDKLNTLYGVLAIMYKVLLSKCPMIYKSHIQYFAYESLYTTNEVILFYKHLIPVFALNEEVATYAINVFKEMLYVHTDIEINETITTHTTEFIELLADLCRAIDVDYTVALADILE